MKYIFEKETHWPSIVQYQTGEAFNMNIPRFVLTYFKDSQLVKCKDWQSIRERSCTHTCRNIPRWTYSPVSDRSCDGRWFTSTTRHWCQLPPLTTYYSDTYPLTPTCRNQTLQCYSSPRSPSNHWCLFIDKPFQVLQQKISPLGRALSVGIPSIHLGLVTGQWSVRPGGPVHPHPSMGGGGGMYRCECGMVDWMTLILLPSIT